MPCLSKIPGKSSKSSSSSKIDLSSNKNTKTQSQNTETVVNQLSKTAMGKNMAAAYINNQYQLKNITANDVKSLTEKIGI